MAVKTRRAEFPPHFGGNLRFDSQARSAGWELARAACFREVTPNADVSEFWFKSTSKGIRGR